MFSGPLKLVLQIVVVLLFGGALFCQSGNRPAEKSIVKIEIDSTVEFTALPETKKWSRVFILRRQDEVYRRAYGETVDAALIEALRVALNERPIARPNLKNLGMTSDWLQGYSWLALHNQLPTSAPRQVLASAFSSPAVLRRVVQRMFDDQPRDLIFEIESVCFTVNFDDDSEVKGDGAGSSPFMLPWSLTRNGKAKDTYNANISLALAALMPPETTNREIIAGQKFSVEVVDAVERYVEANWKRWRRKSEPTGR